MRRHFSTENLVGMAQAGINRLSRLLYRPGQQPQQQDDTAAEKDSKTSSSDKNRQHVDPMDARDGNNEQQQDQSQNVVDPSLPEYLQIAKRLQEGLSHRRRLSSSQDEKLILKSVRLFCNEVANVVSNFTQQKNKQVQQQQQQQQHNNQEIASSSSPNTNVDPTNASSTTSIGETEPNKNGLSPVANSSSSSPHSPPPSTTLAHSSNNIHQQDQQSSNSNLLHVNQLQDSTLSASATPHAESFIGPSSASSFPDDNNNKVLPSFKEATTNSQQQQQQQYGGTSKTSNPSSAPPILRLSRNSEQHWLQFFQICLSCFQVLPTTMIFVNEIVEVEESNNKNIKNNRQNQNLLEHFFGTLLEIIDFEFVHQDHHHHSQQQQQQQKQVSLIVSNSNSTPFSHTLSASAFILLNDILAARPLLLVPLSGFFSSQIVKRCKYVVAMMMILNMQNDEASSLSNKTPNATTNVSKNHSRVPSLTNGGNGAPSSPTAAVVGTPPSAGASLNVASKFSKRGQQQSNMTTSATSNSNHNNNNNVVMEQLNFLLPLQRMLVLLHRSILRCEAVHSEAANEAKTILFFSSSSVPFEDASASGPQSRRTSGLSSPSNSQQQQQQQQQTENDNHDSDPSNSLNNNNSIQSGTTKTPPSEVAASSSARSISEPLLQVFTSCRAGLSSSASNQESACYAALLVEMALFVGSLVRSNMPIKEEILSWTVSRPANNRSGTNNNNGNNNLLLMNHSHHQRTSSSSMATTPKSLSHFGSSSSMLPPPQIRKRGESATNLHNNTNEGTSSFDNASDKATGINNNNNNNNNNQNQTQQQQQQQQPLLGFDQLFSVAVSLLDLSQQAPLLFPLTASLLTATTISSSSFSHSSTSSATLSTSTNDRSLITASVNSMNQKKPVLRIDHPQTLIIGELAETIIELCTVSGEFSRCRIALLRGDGGSYYDTSSKSSSSSAHRIVTSSTSAAAAVVAGSNNRHNLNPDTMITTAGASPSSLSHEHYHLLNFNSASALSLSPSSTNNNNSTNNKGKNDINNNNTKSSSNSSASQSSAASHRSWMSMPPTWDTLLGSSVLFSWRFASLIAGCLMNQESASVLLSIMENVEFGTLSSSFSSSGNNQQQQQQQQHFESSSADTVLRCLVGSTICLCRANPGNAQVLLRSGAFQTLYRLLVPEQQHISATTAVKSSSSSSNTNNNNNNSSGSLTHVSDNLWSISATLLNSLMTHADLLQEDWLVILAGISSLRNPGLSNSPQRELCEFVELCLSTIGSMSILKSSKYLWFDGRKSFASCILKNGLPGAWNGYSVSMWLKPSVVWADGTVLFSITEQQQQQSQQQNNNSTTSSSNKQILSLFSVELVANGAMLQLCIRMSTSKDQVTVIMIPESSFSINTAKVPSSAIVEAAGSGSGGGGSDAANLPSNNSSTTLNAVASAFSSSSANAASQQPSTVTISNSAGVWHHLAANHNMSGLTVFIDGKKCPNLSSVPYISKKSKTSRFVLNFGGSSFASSSDEEDTSGIVVAPSSFGRIAQAQFFDGYLHDKEVERLVVSGPSGTGLLLSSSSSNSSSIISPNKASSSSSSSSLLISTSEGFSNASETAKLTVGDAETDSIENVVVPVWTGSRVDHGIVSSVSAHVGPQVGKTLEEVDVLDFCISHLRSGLGSMPNRSSIVILCTDLLATYFMHCPTGREEWGKKDGPAKLGAELLLWNSVPSQVTYSLFSLIVTNCATYTNNKNQQISTSTGEKKVLFARHPTCAEILHLILDITFGPCTPRASSSILRELANFLNQEANVNYFCQVVGMETFLAYATVCDNSCIEDFVMVVERITKQQREMGELLRFLSWRPNADQQVLTRLDRMKCSFLCMLYDIVKANEEKVPVVQKSLAASILTPGTTTVETPTGVVVEVENVETLQQTTTTTTTVVVTNTDADGSVLSSTPTVLVNYYPIAELIFTANGLSELVTVIRVCDHHETLRICAIRLICMTVYCSPRARTFFNNTEQFNGVALIEESLIHHAQSNGSTFTLNTFQSLVKAALEFYRPNNDAISGSVLSKLRASGGTVGGGVNTKAASKGATNNNTNNGNTTLELASSVGDHSVSFTGHVPSMMELKIAAAAEQQPGGGNANNNISGGGGNTNHDGNGNNNTNQQQQQQQSVTSATSSDGLESRLKSDDGYNASRDRLENPAFIHTIIRLLHAVTEQLRQQHYATLVSSANHQTSLTVDTNDRHSPTTTDSSSNNNNKNQPTPTNATTAILPSSSLQPANTNFAVSCQKFVALALQVFKYIDGILSLTPNVTKMLQHSGFLVLEELFETAKPFVFPIFVTQLEGTKCSLMMTTMSASSTSSLTGEHNNSRAESPSTPRNYNNVNNNIAGAVATAVKTGTIDNKSIQNQHQTTQTTTSTFSQLLASNSIAALTRHIVRSIMIVDVIKNSKTTTRTSVVGEFINNPALQRIVLEETFREMSGRHRIENLDASDANVALKNLEILLSCVEELGFIANHGAPLFPSSLGIELIRCIDSIAAESTPAIRSKLMKTKLIDLRNRLAIHMLFSSDACPCSEYYAGLAAIMETGVMMMRNPQQSDNKNNNNNQNDDDSQQIQQVVSSATSTEEDSKLREQRMAKVIQCCRGDPNASMILFKHLLDAVKNQNADQLSDTLSLIRSLFSSELEQRNAILKVVGNSDASIDILVKTHRVDTATGQMIPNHFGAWVREKPQEWDQQLGKKVSKAVKPVESEMKTRQEKREKECQTRKKQLLQDREKRLNLYNKIGAQALKMLKDGCDRTVAAMERTFTKIQEERVERFDRYAAHEAM